MEATSSFVSLPFQILLQDEPLTCQDPFHPKVTWHHDSEARVSRYEFNTKTRDHMFCPKCGASIGIDFKRFKPDKPYYGISVRIFTSEPLKLCQELTTLQVRQFNDVDLDSLKYKKFDGIHKMVPAGDLSGVEINAETGEPTSSGSQK